MKLLPRSGRRTLAVLAASAAILTSAAVAAPAVAEPAPTSRIAGADRYATSALISAQNYEPGAPVAFITTGTDFPDALAAGPVSYGTGGPILLVTPTLVPGVVYEELERLQPQHIVILGATRTVSAGVEATLADLTEGTVTRVAGSDRVHTSVELSKANFERNTPVVFLTTGGNFPDALAASAIAGPAGAPILLVTWEGVPAALSQELIRLNPQQVLVLGDETAVSPEHVEQLADVVPNATFTRVAGADRFETAALLTSELDPFVPVVYVANGLNFPDALSAGPIAGIENAPMLLVTPDTIPDATKAALEHLKPGHIVVLGGEDNVSAEVEAQLADYVVYAD